MRKEKRVYRKADEIISNYGLLDSYNIQIGFGVTGDLHFGHTREIVNAYTIAKALISKGAKYVNLHVLIDDDTTLKKDVVEVSKHVFRDCKGKLATSIPMLVSVFTELVKNLFQKFENLNVPKDQIIIKYHTNSQLYLNGKYNEAIKLVFDNYTELLSITKKNIALNSNLLMFRADDRTIQDVKMLDNYMIESCGKQQSALNGGCKISFRLEFLLRRAFFNTHYESGGSDSLMMSKQYDEFNATNILSDNGFYNVIVDGYGIATVDGVKISKSKKNGLPALDFIEKYGYIITVYLANKKPFEGNTEISEANIYKSIDIILECLQSQDEERFHHESLDLIWEQPPYTNESLKSIKQTLIETPKHQRKNLSFNNNPIVLKAAELLIQEFSLNSELSSEETKYIEALIRTEDKKLFIQNNGGFKLFYNTLYGFESGPSIDVINFSSLL